ncbi:hypothetical protein BS17DRAFT_108129 [Gyrodon lividus]|nr:hypothetical protein BS17DRAFT_108129 [Gyrodon lividus]
MPCTPTSMFATARASLRHTTTPVEAPINPSIGRTKRQGQPTVNVPSEKMAAFLNEMKTVKLRKVGMGADALGSERASGPSGLSKSVSGTSSTASTGPTRPIAQELLRRRSLANLRVPIGSSLAAPIPLPALALSKEPEVRTGQKRKAGALGVDELTDALHTAKRRLTQSASQSSSGSASSSGSSNAPALLSSSMVPLSGATLPSYTWPTNETDITTPSLCSDNDRDGENSIEDRAPSTPPGPRTATRRHGGPSIDTRERRIEVIDIDMEDPLHTEPRTITPSSVPRCASDLFNKRPPMSPIPNPSPRKPKAPARTKRGATPKPKSLPPPESDEDNTLGARRPPTPVPFLSLIPASRSKTKSKHNLTGKDRSRAPVSTSSQQKSSDSSPQSASGSRPKRRPAHKRCLTLDEELRTAEARSSDIDQGNDELDPEEQEDDVFIGTGTKSKRQGFLAHGGGGGAPVFMGIGYVQGAVVGSANEGPQDGTTETLPRKLHKSASQGSLIPRLRARS